MTSATATTVDTAQPSPKHNLQLAREAYYERIGKNNMAPLWEVLKHLVTKEPVTKAVPALWSFDDFKQLVFEAGEVITAKEAERRVLVLENPGVRGKSAHHQFAVCRHPARPARRSRAARTGTPRARSASSWKARAPTPRSTARRPRCRPGDFVITPNWAAHDHGNATRASR